MKHIHVSAATSKARRLTVVIGVLAAAVASLAPAGGASATPPTADDGFYGVTPTRFMDTRPTGATIDDLSEKTGPVGEGQTVSVQVAKRTPIPDEAASVALNVTVTGATKSTFITVFPKGAADVPTASNLNVLPGIDTPNMVIVPVGADNSVSLFNAFGTVNVIVDVLGWYTAGDNFTGLTPTRLMDTRPGEKTIDHVAEATGTIKAESTVNLQITGRGGVPATGVGSVALNVTATKPTATSFITVFPAGAIKPTASNLNMTKGVTRPNMVIVPVGTNGQISLFNSVGETHLIVDVLGWFPESNSFVGLQPARLMETRSGLFTTDGLFQGGGVVGAKGHVDLQISGRGGVPAADLVGAVALNVTSVSPTATSFITVYPTGLADVPTASNVNMRAGMKAVPNMVIVPLGAGGKVTLFNSLGTTDLLVDILGWFPTNSLAPSTTRVSVTSAGVESNNLSLEPSVSADGRLVAFTSLAALVAEDDNNLADVYVHDRMTKQTTLVGTVDGKPFQGVSSSPQISGNGQFVVFESSAAIVLGDNNGLTDIYMYDIATHETVRVNKNSVGGQASGGDSSEPTINFDGTVVAFTSNATNLGTGLDSLSFSDIFVRNLALGETTRVTTAAPFGLPEANGDSRRASISDDGSVIAFESHAANLIIDGGDFNNAFDIFVATDGAVTSRASVHTDGTKANLNADSTSARISGDGHLVVFQSEATTFEGLVDNAGFNDIYVRDLVGNTTTRVNKTNFGSFANEESGNASISSDGRYITFQTEATNMLTAIDGNNSSDVFLVDTVDDTLTKVASGSVGDSGESRISANGRYIAFSSLAIDLVPSDGNGTVDVFLYDQGLIPL